MEIPRDSNEPRLVPADEYFGTGDQLPASYPAHPSELDGTAPTRTPESIEERELTAAHEALDQLGAPRTRTFTAAETSSGVEATHVLRLHGRIDMAAERLKELGIGQLFERAGATPQPPDNPSS